MRRRFSRKRRDTSSSSASMEGSEPIDAAAALGRIVESGLVGVEALEPIAHEDIPASYAAVGSGQTADGSRVVVGFAPRNAGDALLAAIATGARLVEEDGFAGEVVAIAPQWSVAARRRLALMGEPPFGFRALTASSLVDDSAAVEVESLEAPTLLSSRQVAAQLERGEDRDLFLRAAVALEGLASKHGGALRAVGRRVELIVMAGRVAELRADDRSVVLSTSLGQRSSQRLSDDDLAGALDQLEGQLRKRLNDRRAREAEDGLRARVIPLITSARELKGVVAWPLGVSDSNSIDLVGVDGVGVPILGVGRRRMSLPALGEILDSALRLRPLLPVLLADVVGLVRHEDARLVIAAEEFDDAVTRVLPSVQLAHLLFEIRNGHSRGLELVELASGEAARQLRRRTPRPVVQSERASASASVDAAAGEGGSAEQSSEPRRREGRGRGRRRGQRGRSNRSESAAEGSNDGLPREAKGAAEGEGGRAAERERVPRFDEVSFFDLDDNDRGDAERDEDSAPRRSRGRGRRRGRRASSSSASEAPAQSGQSGQSEQSEQSEQSGQSGQSERSERSEQSGDRERTGRGRGGRTPAGSEPAEADDSLLDDADGEPSETLADIPDEVGDLPVERPSYDDDSEEGAGPGGDGGAPEPDSQKPPTATEAEQTPVRPRRRAVVVACADRDSLLSAVLLARDIRLLEGIWVYPQSEIMTFFRSVATDLREETPIYMIGFTPSPARDVLQAAALYRGRITWFDHHDWPPEDVEGLRQAIGPEEVQLEPGSGSSLPALMRTFTRRSRFSDKLVDLAAGRFTEHDYERWGRLWWSRIGEIAANAGDRRADLEPLLAGRPSDLAKEAAGAATPELPAELRYVSSQDFRLVHFSGYSLVVLEVPAELDLHLCARIARERYRAQLSLATRPTAELVVFGAEELTGRRSLDLGGLVDHLASKLEWVDALAGDDHVARFRLRELASNPDRLDEVIGEIAMGRSLFER